MSDPLAELQALAQQVAANTNEPPGPTSWRPVDLTAALAGDGVEPPSLLRRTDDLRLLYASRTHWFQGEAESLKSWCAQVAVAQVLAGGGNVLYLDFEDNEFGVVERLVGLGVRKEALGNASRFVYVRPSEPLRDRQYRVTPAEGDFQALLERHFDLAVIDGVTESMTTESLDPLDNADDAVWSRRIVRRLADDTGAAVVCVDHVARGPAGQGRYALGGQHKLAGLTGAAYKFTLTRVFHRATGTDSVIGRASLTIEKDRPGYVRGRCPDGKVGRLEMIAYPDGGVSANLDPPTERRDDDEALDRVLGHLAVYDRSTQRQVRELAGGSDHANRDALLRAVEEELVSVEPSGRSHLHSLTDAGRARVQGGTR